MKNDENKQIDSFTDYTTFFVLPATGDDMIQKNIENKKGSFKQKDGISKLGEQSGWDGSFEFKGPSGDYKMNFFLPFSDDNVDGCDNFSGFAVDVTIRS